jgi:antitoxin PrlF
MAVVTLTSKGQMTLPKAVRDDLHVKAGDKLEVVKQGAEYVLRRRRSALELFAELPAYKGKAKTIKEMDEAIGRAVGKRNRAP